MVDVFAAMVEGGSPAFPRHGELAMTSPSSYAGPSPARHVSAPSPAITGRQPGALVVIVLGVVVLWSLWLEVLAGGCCCYLLLSLCGRFAARIATVVVAVCRSLLLLLMLSLLRFVSCCCSNGCWSLKMQLLLRLIMACIAAVVIVAVCCPWADVVGAIHRCWCCGYCCNAAFVHVAILVLWLPAACVVALIPSFVP